MTDSDPSELIPHFPGEVFPTTHLDWLKNHFSQASSSRCSELDMNSLAYALKYSEISSQDIRSTPSEINADPIIEDARRVSKTPLSGAEVAADIEASIKSLQQILDATPDNHPDRADRLYSLAVRYRDLYHCSSDEDDLEHYVQYAEKAVNITPNDHPDRVSRLDDLAVGYKERYKQVGSLLGLGIFPEPIQEAPNPTLEDHHDEKSKLNDPGSVYRSGHRSGLREVGELTGLGFQEEWRQDLDLKPPDHPDRKHHEWTSLAGYGQIYWQNDVSDDLELSIQCCKEALDLIPKNEPSRASRLRDLGMNYERRYHKNRALGDLDLSIQAYQQASDIVPSDHPDRANIHFELGMNYQQRWQKTKAFDDLEHSIQHYQSAIDITPDNNHLERAYRIRGLGARYNDRYKHTNALEDLHLSIQLCDEALKLIPEDHPKRVSWLYEVGMRYRVLYHRSKSMNDLELSIKRLRDAFDITPDDNPQRARELHNLGIGYQDRYLVTRAPEDLELFVQPSQDTSKIKEQSDLDRASRLRRVETGHRRLDYWLEAQEYLGYFLDRLQKALDLISEDHIDRLPLTQALAAGYEEQYKHTVKIEDLAHSIQKYQESLDLIVENDVGKVHTLYRLGTAYAKHYEKTKSLEDLELSLQRLQEALCLTPENHPDKSCILEALGTAYTRRFFTHRELDDLNLAIQQYQKTLDLTAPDHPNRADRLANLGERYRDRYRLTAMLADLEISLQICQEALKITPVDHPRIGKRIEDLISGYNHQYERTKKLEDLHLFVEKVEISLCFAPEGDRGRAARINDLARGYKRLYERTGLSTYLQTSIKNYNQASGLITSYPIDRLRAGRALFSIHVKQENWTMAAKAASEALSLIPILGDRTSQHINAQRQIREIVGLASDAAAIVIKLGRPVYEAINLLEDGRGIMTSSLSDRRSDITDLEEKHPYHADRFHSLRNALDDPQGYRERTHKGARIDELILRIRGLPGFDRFLLSSREDELRMAASYGFVVVLNASKHGSHAFIISSTKFQVIELPLLDVRQVRAKVKSLTCPDIDLLEWLWDTIADPILTALGYTATPQTAWPRIWWIPTGLLVRLPIHAAGKYGTHETSDTVLDRVISSYSSSVKRLIRSRKDHHLYTGLQKQETMVLVGMAQTPGLGALQFATQEVQELAIIGTSMGLHIKQPPTSRKQVLSALAGCKVFHFAGHGFNHHVDPTKSALILNDGRLTVGDIFEINLYQQKPFLAYLSACGTSQMKDDGLIDEGLHLVGACQLAGFRHVIGTLWEVNDKSCVEIARLTYEWLQKQGLSDGSVSEGLHRACRELRRQWIEENDDREAIRQRIQFEKETVTMSTAEPSRFTQSGAREPRDIESLEDLPLHWVPYIHFGI